MELKNTSQWGKLCEQKVKSYLQQKGYVFLLQNWQSPFAEIDLIFRSKKTGVILVEVKSWDESFHLEHPVFIKQRQRILRTVSWLQARGREVEVWLAVVDFKGKVSLFDDVFVDQ